MDATLRKLNEGTRYVRLNDAERAAIRNSLAAYMRAHPVGKLPAERHILQRSAGKGFYPLFAYNPMPIAIIIALVLAGGTSFAAKGSLPGDALYPVKIRVNESIRGSFAFSGEAKAAWEAKAALRRLSEAEALAKEDRLDADARARIEANFQAHAQRLKARMTDLEARGKANAAAEATSNFEASLAAHARILERLRADAGIATKTEIQTLIGALRARGADAAAARAGLEAKVSASAGADVKAAASGRRAAAENKIAEVRKFIAAAKERLGAEATAAAEVRLGAAEALVAEGNAKFETNAYGEAFVRYGQAHRIAQEAKLLLDARSDLDVDVDVGVGSETSAGMESGARGEGDASLEIRITP